VIDLLGFAHVHVSEREAAHQSPCGFDDEKDEDCGWDTAIEFLRASGHPEIPATHAEAEALRCAAGEPPTGPSSVADIRRGIAARYGIAAPPRLAGGQAVWNALRPGFVGLVGGSMGVFAPDSHWRRWDRPFGGGHYITFFRLDATDRLWHCNPQAPLTFKASGLLRSYDGEWMPKAEFLAYVDGLDVGALVAPVMGGTMVGFKPAGAFIGTFRIRPGHSLISLVDTRHHFPFLTWPGGTDVLNVVAAIDLRRPIDGAPIDIEGNSPPLNNRDQLYVVDLPGFGIAAGALRGDGVFTPAEPD
jgi:hypothetical protein